MYLTQNDIMDLISLRCDHCKKMMKLMESPMTVTMSGNIYVDCPHCKKESHLQMRLIPKGIEETEWRSEPAENVETSEDGELLSKLMGH